MSEDSGVIGWVHGIVLDTPDPHGLAAAQQRVLAAGGTPAGQHVSPRPGPDGEEVSWRVYQDPAGHPFCLVTR
jgi:Glyoxalase-like domain